MDQFSSWAGDPLGWFFGPHAHASLGKDNGPYVKVLCPSHGGHRTWCDFLTHTGEIKEVPIEDLHQNLCEEEEAMINEWLLRTLRERPASMAATYKMMAPGRLRTMDRQGHQITAELVRVMAGIRQDASG